MNDNLERAARAFCSALEINPDIFVNIDHGDIASPGSFTRCGIEKWRYIQKGIIAALSELSYPTDKMIDSGMELLSNSVTPTRHRVRDLWGIMLSEITGGEKPKLHSTIQDWVSNIPLRQQGVLLLALRGPDGLPKEHPSKNIVRTLRACVMNSGREGVPMDLGQRFKTDSFMRMDLITSDHIWNIQCVSPFFDHLDQYNIHFYQHFIHAAAVLGFNHPIDEVKRRWQHFYLLGCSKLHMSPETEVQFTNRLKDGLRDEDIGQS